MAREIGDRNGLFEGEHGQGLTLAATGRPDQAVAHHRAALALAMELGQPVDRARALHGLASAQRDLGRLDEARACWRQALELCERLRITEVEELRVADVRAGLAGLDDRRPPRTPAGAQIAT